MVFSKSWRLTEIVIGTRIQIGQRQVEYLLTSGPNPPVVFESGLGGTLDWWAKVYPAIRKSSAALAYNRAGYGESTAAPPPRDGVHIVEELRALLAASVSAGLRASI
jgi:pimeloyl-ACP methyl ester carboxylesterase